MRKRVWLSALVLILPAKQMANDYAYHSNLVASLGGTVLPPCA